MTMAVNFDRPTHRCGQGCRHDPMPLPMTGGRCAYYSPGRPGQICGRESVAVYINERAKVRCTYRCEVHDRSIAQAEAAAEGYTRQPVVRS